MILSTSDINIRKFSFHTSKVYLFLSIFCGIFAAIYEYFSHNVYSNYMIFAFLIPLVGGCFVFLLLGLLVKQNKHFPSSFSRNLYHASLATLTVGSLFQGVLEIYGTTNQLMTFYWIAGFGLLVLSIISYIITVFRYSGR